MLMLMSSGTFHVRPFPPSSLPRKGMEGTLRAVRLYVEYYIILFFIFYFYFYFFAVMPVTVRPTPGLLAYPARGALYHVRRKTTGT